MKTSRFDEKSIMVQDGAFETVGNNDFGAAAKGLEGFWDSPRKVFLP